jgi:hypothetical protein
MPSSLFQEIKEELASMFPVYKMLEEERLKGWSSPEVDALWEIRNSRLEDKKTTSSRGPGYEKYYDFYKKHLCQFSTVFKANKNIRFLDGGSAPGGLACWFVKDLGWSGVGLTLPVSDGGLTVRFKATNSDQFKVEEIDFSSPIFEKETKSILKTDEKFDFVNLGVVIGAHQVEGDLETAETLFAVNRNSFWLMFNYLKDGGDLMWIFPSSKAGAWLFFLDKLSTVFDSIQLSTTIVPYRSPVYAICKNFQPNRNGLWKNEIQSTKLPIDHSYFDQWNFKTTQEAEIVIRSLSSELENIWNIQTKGLSEIRQNANRLRSKPGEAFGKLSGSQNCNRKSRADDNDNWRV